MSKNWENHESVLLREAVDSLHIKNQAKYIDATAGAGGHSEEICKKGGLVLGIDMDPGMLGVARKRLENACPGAFKLALGNFAGIVKIAEENGFRQVEGIIFDLGVSSLHLKGMGRGFSFDDVNSELDMRLNPDVQAVKASDLVNNLRADQLIEIFEYVLEGRDANKLVREIIKAREIKKIEKVGDFLEIIEKVPLRSKSFAGRRATNIATKPFLALRIAVNTELENLSDGLVGGWGLLKPGGYMAVITFHSTEDRIVKNFFRQMEDSGRGKIITKKPTTASGEELERNRKARSAKLRVCQKN